jgi:ATP-dependent Clp protease ATP-binding subunit ClpX
MDRETGVRALRSLFEELLLDVRYTLPEQKDTNSFLITKEIVSERLTHEGRKKKRKKGPRKTA